MKRKNNDEGGEVVPIRSGIDALVAFVNTHRFGGPRDRAYTGQSHTAQGERGRLRVDRTYRDVGDAIAEEIEYAAASYAPTMRNVDVDWEAFVQNVLVRIERNDGGLLPFGRSDRDDCPTCRQPWPRRTE